MNSAERKPLSNLESWKRGAVMLLFCLLLAVITPILILVSLIAWVFLLVQGAVPEGIRSFGRSLAVWYAQTTRYMTGNALRRPFPFEDLDCPVDEPLAADLAVKSRAGPARGSEAVPAAAEQAVKAPEARPAKTVTKKAGAKKVAKKPAAKKKATKKKSGSKKAGHQKPVENDVAAPAANDMTAPDSDRES